LAGATAERSGNFTAARHAYEQALADAPGSLSAALALLDIARRQDDRHLTLRAYTELSQTDVGGGVPELFALLRGDELGSSNEAGASGAYEQALEHPTTMLAAAIALLSMPSRLTTADQRLAAEEALSDAGAATQADADGFAAAYGALRASLGEEGSASGDAWLQIATSAPTEGLRAGALLQGLRVTSIARGSDATDEIFLLAQEAEGLSGIHADAAIAIDEALAPADDAELRVRALEQKLHHSESVGRGALGAAHCRTLVEADRGADAVALLSSAVDERPDDLALWETLRRAARRAGQWPLVAQGCERLAPFVEGSLRADLLEEAGVVRMDCLAQYQQAEDLFRRALSEDPTRDIAFRRLRDLLVAQEDAEALEVLVSERLALGGPKDRLDLLYERARLLRGFSDRPGALEALGELFTAEPDHAGALALAAEVHVSLEQWAEAVECLRRLSKASIPADQRRVAHLGAADFLEAQLGAKDEALEELRAVEALGLADAETWTRIGMLEVELGSPGAAIEAYGRAIEAEPTNEIAISGLVELLDEAAKEAALATYERAIWERIDVGELDESLLEALRRAAGWRGQSERAAAALAVQGALGLAEPSGDDSADLGQVSVAAVWDPNADSVLQEVVLRAGPSLTKNRQRAKKANPSDPVFIELQRMSQRFGGRTGSVGLSDQLATLVAHAGGDGEIDWVVPHGARAGLDARGRFIAGRLAWAVPHGGAQLLDDSVEKAAGTLGAILRVSRCEVAAGEPSLPVTDVKLRRAVRKAVRQTVGDTKVGPSALLAFARSLQRSADRAGLLASGEIVAALAVLLSGRLNLDTLRTSVRGLDLLRFWLDADSPLWGSHG
jgi:tetratricopeptide (TPR) repeat protein